MGFTRILHHRCTKAFTGTFPVGCEARPMTASQPSPRSDRKRMNRSHWHISTPSGVVQWWPASSRWHMPGERKSKTGREKELLRDLKTLTEGGE